MKITAETKVFIAGCGGMLGRAVYKEFSDVCQVLATDIDVNEDWLSYADVRQLNETWLIVQKFAPDLIINLAALTDLEYCEKDAENSWATNALGAENLALQAAWLNVPHVYISTAGIFDGKQEFYHDFDQPQPLCVYAKSKYHGEQVVQRLVPRHFVFRAGWMMGGGVDKDKKFINKIYQQIKAGQKELFVVDDKLGTPTYTVDFARGIRHVVEADMYGVYNQVCAGSGSRYDVAKEFLNCLGLTDKIKLTMVDSDHFKKEYFAPRPASEKLITAKLDARGVNMMRDWKVCLQEYAQAHFMPDFAATQSS